MTSEIKAKYSASAAFTITLASLASSTAGVGRQTTLIDNSVTRYQSVIVYGKIKQGTSPTGSKGVYVYLIRGDANATPHRTDAAGASDAAHTVLNAPLVAIAVNKASPSTGDDLYFECVINDPGPEWGLTVVHDTVAALDATAGNHWLRWIGVNPEAQ